MMNMGEKIRMHRLRRSMTQERLSQSVGVTAQAVSKWESGQSYPDIALLPEPGGGAGRVHRRAV